MEDRTHKKFVSLPEFAEIIGRPTSTVRRWASERRFPLYKMFNRIVVEVDEGLSWMEQFRVKKIK